MVVSFTCVLRGRDACSFLMFDHGFVVLDQMVASPDLVLALVLRLRIRRAGKVPFLHNHPILDGSFRVDPLYLDSLVDVLITPAHPVLAFGYGLVSVSLATPFC